MLLNELFEAGTKHVTFCFGRMNPPTVGHKQVFDTMSSQGGDMKIFVSQSQDKKKNPLDYGTKIKFIKAMFPKYAKDVVDNAALNTIGKVASYLHEQGYTAVTFVAGSDRMDSMKSLLDQYNGVEGKAHGFYKFDVIDFSSSGDREDGAEGVAGVSASGARSAAANNDFKAFQEATGAGELAKPLFAAVRKGMGIKGEVEESSLNEFDPGEDGFGPFKVYVHDEFIEKFATFDQAKEEIEFLRTADPKSFDADWKIIDGTGKTVWQHDPGEAIDAMRMRRKLQFIKPDEGVEEDISRRGFLRGVGAAAAGVGAANTAQAQISGEDTLPDIVAHVRFKVNGQEINKEINLGTTYKSPKEAGAALEKFLKSKGIKYYEYELERVKPKEKVDYESQ